jgi:hypothetical protein
MSELVVKTKSNRIYRSGFSKRKMNSNSVVATFDLQLVVGEMRIIAKIFVHMTPREAFSFLLKFFIASFLISLLYQVSGNV